MYIRYTSVSIATNGMCTVATRIPWSSISSYVRKCQYMDKFEFPPKKNIGRRDAKLVEDRRQRLQNYLRYMVHILSNTMSPSKPPLFTESLNKQKFLQLLPFFADPPVLNSNSRTASPALGHCPGGRRSSTQLPAPPRSPTYKGL